LAGVSLPAISAKGALSSPTRDPNRVDQLQLLQNHIAAVVRLFVFMLFGFAAGRGAAPARRKAPKAVPARAG